VNGPQNLLRIAAGKSVRPMLPWNRVSPATSLFSSGIHKLMLPWVWPGVSST